MWNIDNFVQAVGIIGVTMVVFAESGLLIGFFLPGDSLLITAGLLAAGGYFNIVLLVVLVTIAAVVGDSVGYATGKALGPRVFTKHESLFFKKEYITRTEVFFQKHGPWSIVLARFIPVVRTFTPIMAGVGSMNYRTFFWYNVMGGIGWGAGLTVAGYLAGVYVPGLRDYIEYVVIAIVILSFLPIVLHLTKRSS